MIENWLVLAGAADGHFFISPLCLHLWGTVRFEVLSPLNSLRGLYEMLARGHLFLLAWELSSARASNRSSPSRKKSSPRRGPNQEHRNARTRMRKHRRLYTQLFRKTHRTRPTQHLEYRRANKKRKARQIRRALRTTSPVLFPASEERSSRETGPALRDPVSRHARSHTRKSLR